ncbi:hypothetical protein, variant [Exophiala xenobiotica]|uniref:Uncharacterized protein n=1 Tax=Exophiala xenobiotica TaxID=348802 RepID=A0A0D2E7L1_9EURO|nr:hypothetical protein, variant [Exophiala xenobiotica]KIW51438.1 hypothetical protein, variant [Exophiala xenobiotica]
MGCSYIICNKLTIGRSPSSSEHDTRRPRTAPAADPASGYARGQSAARSPRRARPDASSTSGVSSLRTRNKRPHLSSDKRNNTELTRPWGALKPTSRTSTPDESRSTGTSPIKAQNTLDTDSIPSTVSPSQPVYRHEAAPGNEISGSRHDSVVDLTTPVPLKPACQNTESRHLFGGISNCRDSDTGRPSKRKRNLVRQLPNEIRGPNAKGGQARFRTHVTKTLGKLAVRVPLSNHFRPVYVARDVNVLERGYWQFSIHIVDSSTTEAARKDEAACVWTEKEFVQFWQNLSRFVQDGKAGWGTALVKEEDGERLWRIRLFTWAEVLGHVWLVLWVLSDKLTERIPMQWIAGDGTLIVKMSREKQKRGRLGTWVRKGPEDERGSWGFA